MAVPLQRFLIAPLVSGQQTNVKPWLIANDAYESLRNSYIWRGRLKKRFGGRVMDQSQPIARQQQFTRLRINVGTTNGAGGLIGFVPGAIFKVGQMFSIGTVYYTVNALGNPAPLLSTNPASAFTYDTTLGTFTVLNAAPNTIVYFYPAEPVMHIGLYERVDINNEITIAFDTQFSYQYTTGTGWNRSGAVPAVWTGSNSQFYWSTNYRGTNSYNYLFFVVNNNVADGIKYFDNINWTTLAAPVINAAGDTLLTSLIVLPFKDRLLFLNVTESIGASNRVFANRVRFSQNGDPLQVDAFREDLIGKGGYIEAPTKEAIISAEFLKDRLIVFFENSTWELVYNGNQILPFSFQKINTELGVESTHSIIPFDKVAIGMGSTGIHSCSGVNVERIDALIPSTIFDISNINDGSRRVYGIRDYYEELCYWSFAASSVNYRNNNTFPNRVLVYDYITSTWSYNDDSITAFGYFYLQENILVWQAVTSQWGSMTQTWEDFESDQLFRSVLAGNQEGWTFIVTPDLERNCMSLQITDIVQDPNFIDITVIDHNIGAASVEYVFIQGIQSTNNLLTNYNNSIWRVVYVDKDTLRIYNASFGADTYLGGGTLELVTTPNILTKQYNFFTDQGKYTFISHADFYVGKTDSGQCTIDYYASTSNLAMVPQGVISGSLIGTSILETSPYALNPLEQTQEQFWHRLYFQTLGETIQLNIYFSQSQTEDPEIAFADFTLNAMLFYARMEQSYF